MESTISKNNDFFNPISPSTAISRLTALWALHEAGLGGMLHLFNTPLTGLVMASVATILITLIAHFSNRKHTVILKCLILVMITKVIVSPQSGIPAFVAVILQGLVGAFLFKYIKSLRIAAILLGVFALTESAIQKVFLMVLMFGKSFLTAIDTFIAQSSQNLGFSINDGSIWIAGSYLTLYFLIGILVGYFSYRLVKNINQVLIDGSQSHKIDDTFISIQQYYQGQKKNKNRKMMSWLGILAIVGIIFLILVFINPSKYGWYSGLLIALRTGLFLIVYFFVLNPLLTKVMKSYLSKKQSKYKAEVDDIFEFMNTLRKLVGIAWYETAHLKGLNRLSSFITKSIVYTLLYEDQ